jgi:hypothetical protein
LTLRADGPAFQILADSQFSATGAAKHRLLVELGAIPNARAVASLRLVAIKAGIIAPATGELDCDDIDCAPIVSAAGVRICSDTMYQNSRILTLKGHRSSSLDLQTLGVWGVSSLYPRPAALMTDYVLNVAVGISAGVGALISATPALQPHTLTLCLVILIVLTVVNLRGIGEAGRLFMPPTCAFVLSLGVVLCWGMLAVISSHGHPHPVVAPPQLARATEAVGGVGVVTRVRERVHCNDRRRSSK